MSFDGSYPKNYAMSQVNAFQREKKVIADAVRHQPVAAAMFEKNWNRYAAVVQYATRHLTLDPGKTILDYGSGFPFVSKLLLLLGYNVCSYEPYASAAELEIAHCLGIERFYTRHISPEEQFACVFMIDVIEHLSVIKQTMVDVGQKTAPGGFLVVSTPNVLRIEMWLRFLLRQTGHPQGIDTFVRSDNNYVNHQREFTMDELHYALQYFGFKPVYSNTVNTQPSRESLAHYHRLLGQKVLPFTAWQSLRKGGFDLLKGVFPRQFANNLLVIAQREAKPGT